MNANKFWAKVQKSDGCWVWQGCIVRRYGVLGHDGKQVKAHRVAWGLTNGPIPNGLSVLHKCDNPPCVRPDHLFLGTQLDNMRDCSAKGRSGIRGMNGTGLRDKEHCFRGHLLSPENIYIGVKAGAERRMCRLCRKIHNAAHWARMGGRPSEARPKVKETP